MFTIFVLMIFGSLIGLLLCSAVVMYRSNLQRRFRNLGVLAGRSMADIIAIVGHPNAITALPFGGTLLQWQRFDSGSAYQIALGFDAAGVCRGVTHEYKS